MRTLRVSYRDPSATSNRHKWDVSLNDSPDKNPNNATAERVPQNSDTPDLSGLTTFQQIVTNMGEAFFMATPDLQNFLYVSLLSKRSGDARERISMHPR